MRAGDARRPLPRAGSRAARRGPSRRVQDPGREAILAHCLAGWSNRQLARFWPWNSRFESLPGSVEAPRGPFSQPVSHAAGSRVLSPSTREQAARGRRALVDREALARELRRVQQREDAQQREDEALGLQSHADKRAVRRIDRPPPDDIASMALRRTAEWAAPARCRRSTPRSTAGGRTTASNRCTSRRSRTCRREHDPIDRHEIYARTSPRAGRGRRSLTRERPARAIRSWGRVMGCGNRASSMRATAGSRAY
ncbi:MAG: hypothetical protein QOJ46_1378 [bacterium]